MKDITRSLQNRIKELNFLVNKAIEEFEEETDLSVDSIGIEREPFCMGYDRQKIIMVDCTCKIQQRI